MNHGLIASSALASVLVLGLVAHAAAKDKTKEKCYGIAKAGQNDCANIAGTHSCSGTASTDNDPGSWKYVATGTCQSLSGMSLAQARAKIAASAKAKT